MGPVKVLILLVAPLVVVPSTEAAEVDQAEAARRGVLSQPLVPVESLIAIPQVVVVLLVRLVRLLRLVRLALLLPQLLVVLGAVEVDLRSKLVPLVRLGVLVVKVAVVVVAAGLEATLASAVRAALAELVIVLFTPGKGRNNECQFYQSGLMIR